MERRLGRCIFDRGPLYEWCLVFSKSFA
jgi:hypothetical protein